MSLRSALEEINELIAKKISGYDLENYWRGSDLDRFVRRICVDVYFDWKNSNDQKAMGLLNKIVLSLRDELIFKQYSEALEKRYAKPEGTINDLIFHENILTPSELLNRLKIDDWILL